jgi:HNH endonuclease
MAITKAVRDQLLVEARHRCTICSEKCFEIHHIIERAEGGSDELENLIVLCPNCHQHRYHRSGEFTREQLRLYKQKLREQNEIERRVLQNLEEIRQNLATVPPEESERKLKAELQEAAELVSPERSKVIHEGVEQTSRWLAERDLLRGGARRAIEIEWEVWGEQEKSKYPEIRIARIDDSAWRKAPDFPAAYVLEFVLNRVPNSEWVQIFVHNYQQAFYNMKRRTEIRGDRIIMIVDDSDNLQGHANFAKRLVEETNQFIRTQLFPHIDQEVKRRKREALQQFDTIQSLKARTKDIKL